jgi:hypothetical protein
MVLNLLQGRTSWWGAHDRIKLLTLGSQEAKRESKRKGQRTKHTLQVYTNDLLPPTRPHFLKFLPPPQGHEVRSHKDLDFSMWLINF